MNLGQYHDTVQDWRNNVEIEIKEEDNWLAFAGVYWLKEGENSIGVGEANDIVLPGNSIPEVAGLFTLEQEKVMFRAADSVPATLDGETILEAYLKPNVSGKISIGPSNLKVVEHKGEIGFLFWDNKRKERVQFPGRVWYPVQKTYCVTADLESFNSEQLVTVHYGKGDIIQRPAIGKLHFTLHDQLVELVAFEGTEGGYFIVFSDTTNEAETYSAGRFLEPDRPENGRLILDFNRAFNPPCAFSTYCNCPLPPSQNKLKIPITAGEKRVQWPTDFA